MNVRDLLLQNFRWKLFSLIFAAAIWFYIQSTIKDEVILKPHPTTGLTTGTFLNRFPVKVMTANGDVHVYRVEPDEAEVNVSGERSAMDLLNKQEIRVFVDMTDADTTASPIHATNEFARQIQVQTPPGVTVVRVIPPAALVKRLPLSQARPSVEQPNP